MTVKPYYADEAVTLHHGDALDVLRSLPDASVDAVVTDPPYGLEFMGKDWDSFKPSAARLRTRVDGRTNPAEGKSVTTTPEAYVAGAPFQRWCEQWAVECLRVLKPGGHLLAFGGTRTVHRLTAGVEDAGFEIRDSIMWHYGSGFPKSLNVSKDPQFCQCDVREWSYGDGGLHGVRQGVSDVSPDAPAGEVADLLSPVQRQGTRAGVGDARSQGAGGADAGGCGVVPAQDERRTEPGLEGRGHVQAAEGQLRRASVRALPGGVPGDGADGRLRDGAPAGDGPSDRSAAAAVGGGQPHRPQPPEQRPDEPGAVSVERGSQAGRSRPVCGGCGKPSVPAGLGTALKPATEPIVVARKPLAGTVAANVLAYGTGALNIDATRVGTTRAVPASHSRTPSSIGATGVRVGEHRPDSQLDPSIGRWPSNVVLSHAPDCGEQCVPGCPVAELDRQSGVTRSPAGGSAQRELTSRGYKGGGLGQRRSTDHDLTEDVTKPGYADQGGASRFFPVFRYEAKAPTAERPRTADGTAHPTVKPLDLMRWLVRLVTPAGGVVLEPFAGSGTTAEACVLEGFRCIAIEREAAYLPLITARLTKPLQPALDFGDAA